MKKPIVLSLAILTGVFLIALRAGVSEETGIPDTEIGLSKASAFDVPEPAPVRDNTSDPGEGSLIPAAFADAPPPVPHGVEEFLPISWGENQCIDCHLVEEKAEGEPTPIPRSHFVDLRFAPEETQEVVVGARFVCVSCHVSLTATDALVDNVFRP